MKRVGTLAILLILALGQPATSEPFSRSWLDADGRPLPFESADQVVEFLATATVVDAKTLSTGITKPRKLTLERDGVRAHAVFHSIDRRERQVKRLENGQLALHLIDSYRNQVAAYELSRLLGIDSVPPTALREVDGRVGSAQLWVQNAMTEQKRRDRALEPPDWTLWNQQLADRWIFDNLINNIDRNTGNTLIDSSWSLWLIDHTRTFGQDRQLPYPERIESLSKELWAGLSNLDPDQLRERLEPYLGKPEIKSLLLRHQRLVAAIEERIARRGEERVVREWGQPRVTVTVTVAPSR